jgi:hypothetical protein
LVRGLKAFLGWAGVVISTAISGLWAYWGAFENFHEGWYSQSLAENLLMFVFQYLLFPIIFIGLALVSIRWKKAGLILHAAACGVCAWFFRSASVSVLLPLIILPIAVLGSLYYFGEPAPRKWAYRLILAVPLVILAAISIPQVIKVSQRIDDGDLGLRVVKGNGVTLAWAPRGPGWPDKGVSWEEAQDICEYLSEDGTVLMEEKQNIWRLPTVEEAVRSMALHGVNAGGVWDEETSTARYEQTPDKESPLWDVHSKVIYYWTSDAPENDADQAYIVVYNGGVYTRARTSSQGYLSFRAVKEVRNDEAMP